MKRRLDELWQTIKSMQESLFKTSDPDIPKRWNCCDMLVPPNHLAEHIKEYHMRDYIWTESDKIEFINIIWILANLILISIL